MNKSILISRHETNCETLPLTVTLWGTLKSDRDASWKLQNNHKHYKITLNSGNTPHVLLPEPEKVKALLAPRRIPWPVQAIQQEKIAKSMGYPVHKNSLLLNNWVQCIKHSFSTCKVYIPIGRTITQLNTQSGNKGSISTPWRWFPVWIVQTLVHSGEFIHVFVLIQVRCHKMWHSVATYKR